jgi:hypothetical protein
MKISKVILSSDSNPKYLDFWPYVSKAWKELIGIEPVLFFIGPINRVPELQSHGTVIHVEESSSWDIVNQAQCVRLWGATRFPDECVIISDMDMLPISKTYFLEQVKDIDPNFFISYTSDVLNFGFYKRIPQFPMCYLAGSGKTFSEILELKETDCWKIFMGKMKDSHLGYGTDQKYFYSKYLKWEGKSTRYIGLERGWIGGKIAKDRLDKVSWPIRDYDPFIYSDCHLPIPLMQEKDKCEELFNKLNLI